MGAEPSSLMKAMEVEAAGIAGAHHSAEQLDLLRGSDGRLPSDAFRQLRDAAPKGPGRPAGAANRKTKELARLIVQQHGDPVLAMASVYSMPLDQLVELLLVADGSREREHRLLALIERTEAFFVALADSGALTDKKLEKLELLIERVGDLAKGLKSKPGELAVKALNTQLAAAREVAAFTHSKMPIAVDVNTRADVILNIPGLTDPAHLAEFIENAELTEGELAAMEVVPNLPAPGVPIEDGVFIEVDEDRSDV